MFRPELAAKVLAGEKTVTRRFASPNPRSPWHAGGTWYTAGKRFTVNPGRGALRVCEAIVLAADLYGWNGTIELDEARREGFASPAEFLEAFVGINRRKRVESGTLLWRIEFEVVGD